jgi:dolichol-phosphate hexosyltransferase
MKLTILMPALNEEKSIGKTISRIPIAKLRDMDWESEILVVDGGSNDRTIEIAENLGAKVLKSPRGYGQQYQAGFQKSGGDVIVTADSDCSYPMEEIPDLLKILVGEKLDFISTNRFAFMEKDSMRLLNKLGNKVLTLITNFLYNLNLKDSQSGMWVIRREILPKIKLTSAGMPLSQEIKIEAFRKFRAKEVNSSYRKRVGKVKLRMFLDGMDNLTSLLKRKIQG